MIAGRRRTSSCCTARATSTTWPGATSSPTSNEAASRCSYVPTVSRPNENPGWSGCTGRVEAIVESQLDEHGLTPETATLYVCGNPEMITAVEEIAAERGFPPEQVRKELYWPKGREH